MKSTFEYCDLCKRKIHDWRTHTKSSEHLRNARQILIDRGELNDTAKSGTKSITA